MVTISQDHTPFMDIILEYFGNERILYGSDWPVCLLAADYKNVFQLVQNFISQFDERIQARILGENAITFYNL